MSLRCRRHPGALRRPAAAAFAVLLGASLWGCLGGSDGIENPKLELEFRPVDAPPAAGVLTLWSRGTSPLQDSLPFLSKPIPSNGKVTVTPEELDAAMGIDRARRGWGPLGDTIASFNAVAVSGDRETFASGFSYRRIGAARGFAVAPKAAGDYGVVRGRYGLPAAVTGFHGRIGKTGALLGIDLVYIPGSPYRARVDTASAFAIPRLPQGVFGIAGADADSAKFYRSSDSLNTADTAYSAKAWDVIYVIP